MTRTSHPHASHLAIHVRIRVLLSSETLVRVDEAYDRATTEFDYANMTAEGLVDNTMTILGSDMRPVISRVYVLSTKPPLTEEILAQGGASFGGLVERDFVRGVWQPGFICASIPVTVYVHSCDVTVGFDYFLRS